MNVVSKWRMAICVLLFWQPQPVLATDKTGETLRAKIDGIYALEEWHTNAGVFRPPQVDGRFILHRGAVALILHNRIEEASQTTNASYGSYVLSSSGYSYRYEDTSIFTQTSSAVTVSHTAPWEGLRSFSVSNEGQTVVLRAAGGEQFSFSAEGLTYSEKGKVLRVWRRMRQ